MKIMLFRSSFSWFEDIGKEFLTWTVCGSWPFCYTCIRELIPPHRSMVSPPALLSKFEDHNDTVPHSLITDSWTVQSLPVLLLPYIFELLLHNTISFLQREINLPVKQAPGFMPQGYLHWAVPLYTGAKVLPKGIILINAFVLRGQGDRGPDVNSTEE